MLLTIIGLVVTPPIVFENPGVCLLLVLLHSHEPSIFLDALAFCPGAGPVSSKVETDKVLIFTVLVAQEVVLEVTIKEASIGPKRDPSETASTRVSVGLALYKTRGYKEFWELRLLKKEVAVVMVGEEQPLQFVQFRSTFTGVVVSPQVIWLTPAIRYNSPGSRNVFGGIVIIPFSEARI